MSLLYYLVAYCVKLIPDMLKVFIFISFVLLASCSTAPPKNINNSCDIFREKDDWYDDAMASYERWGVPVHVQLAIIHQESRFKYDARDRDGIFFMDHPYRA